MELHLTTADAWAAMIAACEDARISIDFEQYIVKADEVGNAFLSLLARKARQGVRVRIILDAFGSRAVSQSPLMRELREAGAQVVLYHRLRPASVLNPASWVPRTHAKLLHVDDRTTFLGSMCLAVYMRDWRDTMVRLEDGLAEAARRDFAELWHDLQDGRLDGDEQETPVSVMAASYVSQNPKGGHYPLYDALVEAVNKARNEVCIATPYFFPPARLRQALMAAMARGVRVRLLLSHRTDVALADHVTRVLLPEWSDLGFAVRIYKKTVLHAKYAVIDTNWATLGSCNFDYLSLCRNREANIILRDPDAVAQLAQCFEADEAFAHRPEADDARARGVWGWLGGRLGAWVLRRV
ncbi:MAG: phosphatidylserine/phosphatidylglycerophosphate/cardiolipin synthase family protein [Asticcacaulis sp.]